MSEHKDVETRLAEIEARRERAMPVALVQKALEVKSPGMMAVATLISEDTPALLAVVAALIERNKWQDWCLLCGRSVSMGHKPECALAALGGCRAEAT